MGDSVYSSEFNSESASSDEIYSVEAKSTRKRNHQSLSPRKSSISHGESNTSVPASANAEHLRSDDFSRKKFLTKGGEKAPFDKESMIAHILKIVHNPEIMDGPEVYNDFNRIKHAKKKENQGQIQLHIISNSVSQPVTDEVFMWLVGLQNLFFHGLPAITRSYITRLVFDPKHRNLVLVKDNNVIGGICFRMFPTKDFSEIVFLVVSSSYHVQGYGSHMLNHLKDYHIKHNIHNLLTYAAMEAFKYFQKQGFSSKITLPESVYQGYINVYQEATLMECQLDKRISYTELPEVISRQKMIVQKLIEKYQMSNRENSKEKSIYEANSRKLKKL